MFRIAIVEDQEETRESLNRFVRQYAQEQGLQVEISLITDGAEIAEHYTPGFDIIFMDVEMPWLDGFGAAEAVRAVDADVVLTEKSLLCESRGIQLNAVANGSCLGFFEAGDLYALFANALDHAVESAVQVSRPECRVIDLLVCVRQGFVVVNIISPQRPLFTIFNTVGSLLGMGAMQFFAPILAKNYEGGYAAAGFFRTLAPVGIVISILLTLLAVVGIWEKDQPKYFGIGGEKTEKIKVREYLQIIKNNGPMQRLMVAGAGCKLALSIATNTTVLCMLYGCMMGNYDGLYLPMMVLGYVCSVPFFLLTVRTSQKEGQKASLMKYVSVALVCYVGVLVLLLWGRGDAFTLSILGENGLSINLYTILFIAFFGIGYGAYYATADMPIPMVADCSDYEIYRSGKYIPGIMGTLFSLVDKLVSSLSATVVGIAVSFVGLQSLPTQYDPYTPGMNWVVIVLFCIIPMVAWTATLIAMKGYTLTGAKMKEIQAVNACRRDAVANGMKLEEAMDKWQTMDQLPAEYRS